MSTDKPPTVPNPQTAAIMALAAPLIHQFAAELATLPAESNSSASPRCWPRCAGTFAACSKYPSRRPDQLKRERNGCVLF